MINDLPDVIELVAMLVVLTCIVGTIAWLHHHQNLWRFAIPIVFWFVDALLFLVLVNFFPTTSPVIETMARVWVLTVLSHAAYALLAMLFMLGDKHGGTKHH